MKQLRGILLLAMLGVGVANSQVTEVSAPNGNYLLEISQRWGRTSMLGDLLHEPRDSNDVEVRLWGGYGLTGTAGVILSRRQGRWSSFVAEVEECSMPVTNDEPITDARRTELENAARRHCPKGAEGALAPVYWLKLHDYVPPSSPSDTWTQLLQAGVLRVPPDPPSPREMLDGFTYVLEVRVGKAYRASVLPQSESWFAEPDSIVRKVALLLGFERRSQR